MKIPLRAQIDALELAIANKKGHIHTLQELVKAKKRPEMDLFIAQQPLEALEAGLKTLKWVEANEKRIKEALARQEGA